MTQITGNIFDIDSVKITKKVRTNYLRDADKILDDVGLLKNSVHMHHIVKFKEVLLDFNTWANEHFNIMKSKKIVMLYDESINKYKLINPEGIVYICEDNKLLSLLINLNILKKITYDYNKYICSEELISLKFLSEMLFNVKIKSLRELVKLFFSEEEEIEDNCEYSLLLYLFQIYDNISYIFNKSCYWKYIYTELSTYRLSCIANYYFDFDKEYILNLKKNGFEELRNKRNELNLGDNIIFKNKHTLLNAIKTNTELTPSLNPFILKAKKDSKMLDLLKLYDNQLIYSLLLNNAKLPIVTFNCYGLIQEPYINLNSNFSTKDILVCHFEDLFMQVLIQTVYFKGYNNNNKDKYILEALLSNKYDLSTAKVKAAYMEIYIKALVLGLNSDEEIISYFESKAFTYITLDDLEELKLTYNKDLESLKRCIDAFNDHIYLDYNPMLISHKKTTPLFINVYNKINTLMKLVISDLEILSKNYNEKNKEHFNVIHFDCEKIYIIYDSEALSSVVELVRLILIDCYKRICKNNEPFCIIDVLPK